MEMVSRQSRHPDVGAYMSELGRRARIASRAMARMESAAKNAALATIADALESESQHLLAENRRDLDAGERNGLDAALSDRLALTDQRVQTMAQGLRELVVHADPIGEITELKERPSGIQVGKMRVSLGVIGIIYESRPNVTADAAGLCLKSGNAAILRGGSEAIYSNGAIAKCIRMGLSAAGLPADTIQVVEITDRAAVGELVRMKEHVDVIVPRGGKSLIEHISQEALIPVIKHLDGVCHVYIDDRANVEKALKIAFNAKTQRYGTCNAMETLLVAREMAEQVLPRLAKMYREVGVELRGCPNTCAVIPEISVASDEDWSTEYLAPILAIRVVDTLDQAIEHIHAYGSGHTDAIVTEDLARARRFLREVDSSSVMVNASTRFADGYEYGLGAEIGISTDKLHARGPVGLEGLTSQKFIVLGDGHIRE